MIVVMDGVTRGLEIHVNEGGREAVLVGRLDARTAAGARSCLHDVLFEADGDLTLNLGELQIWDSTGLGVLVGLSRHARRSRRAILFSEVSPRELRLLRVARISGSVVTEHRSMVG